jgi:glycosyltransferase involved in cell wall biosynthesis
MKILIAYDWFLKLVVDGQASALRSRGHDVRLLCRDHAAEFGDDPHERELILGRLSAQGIDHIEIRGSRFGLGGLGSVARAARDIRRWRPDIVSVHENNDPRLLALCAPYRIVYTWHDPEPHPGVSLPRLVRGTLSGWLRAADHLIVHGPQLRSHVPRRLRAKPLSVVPHGIEVAPSPMPAPDDEIILFFGRLEHWKGIPILAEAMKEVWRFRPQARLVVAGRGPAASSVPRDARIALREGYVPEADVRALFSEAAVVVLPYLQIAQSGVGLLSLSHGIPTVVTRTGALPELAVDERYIAEPGDAQSLAASLIWALEHGGSDRDRIWRYATTTFSWDAVAEEYERIYLSVVGNP